MLVHTSNGITARYMGTRSELGKYDLATKHLCDVPDMVVICPHARTHVYLHRACMHARCKEVVRDVTR